MSAETSRTQEAGLRLERTFEASAEEVFDAWTNPEVMRRWWAPGPTWRTPIAEIDLCVGGRYRLSMEDPESGTVLTVGGEYSEVLRPRRLVYSWRWEQGGAGAPGETTAVSVEFIAEGDRTTVVLEHTGFATEEVRERHRAGWEGSLENLLRRIFSGA